MMRSPLFGLIYSGGSRICGATSFSFSGSILFSFIQGVPQNGIHFVFAAFSASRAPNVGVQLRVVQLFYIILTIVR